MVQSRTIDSTNEPACCKLSDGFKEFNRHGEQLFGSDEMKLTHRHYSFTTYLSYLNDDTNKMFTPLPNLEHDLRIDNNETGNPTSLSNALFLEEDQLSTPSHKDITYLHLDTPEQSILTITQPEDDAIKSVDEIQTKTLISLHFNVKCQVWSKNVRSKFFLFQAMLSPINICIQKNYWSQKILRQKN